MTVKSNKSGPQRTHFAKSKEDPDPEMVPVIGVAMESEPATTDPKPTPTDATSNAEPRKATWRDGARKLWMLRQRSAAMPTDAKVMEDLAEKRGQLLTARLLAASKRGNTYPRDTLKQWEFELAALVNGTWFPGMKRPRNKEFDKSFHGFAATSSSRSVEAESRLDQLLVGPDE